MIHDPCVKEDTTEMFWFLLDLYERCIVDDLLTYCLKVLFRTNVKYNLKNSTNIFILYSFVK